MHIGLYFGSFNPIHIGHLIIANYILEFINLEKVWFIVSPQSPFKKKISILNEIHRLNMVILAINDFKKMKVLDLEFNMSKPSYTINTLLLISKLYPYDNFYIIIGSDTLLYLNKWKNYINILYKYPIYVYPRLNYNNNISLAYKHGNIYKIDAPIIDISASFIRKSILEGKNIKPFLPLKTWEYIQIYNLYK